MAYIAGLQTCLLWGVQDYNLNLTISWHNLKLGKKVKNRRKCDGPSNVTSSNFYSRAIFFKCQGVKNTIIRSLFFPWRMNVDKQNLYKGTD